MSTPSRSTLEGAKPAFWDFVNPLYLQSGAMQDIQQSVIAKPSMKYCVLDNFLREDAIQALIAHHATLKFSEADDRRGHNEILPYDGAVKWADDSDVGADFFFEQETHKYFHYLLAKPYVDKTVEVKLRWHKPDACGFWIHSDSSIRSIVAILYFNHGWKASDGGLLQLWRPDEAAMPGAPVINGVDPHVPQEFLTQHQRLRTDSPGGGWPAHWQHSSRDLVLVDQIVPVCNRLFLCDLDADPTFHSVTPGRGRARTGFVMWLNNKQPRGNPRGAM